MAPVIKGLEQRPENLQSLVCVMAQHREMLDQVLAIFEIKPEYNLNIMLSEHLITRQTKQTK
jgi:UDP-N-acetylglucosamine 2-epimerase (non-hydrolysing)